jgi:Domain of unknown function (DUF4112)
MTSNLRGASPARPSNAPPGLEHEGFDQPGDDRYLELAERIAFWMDRRYVDPILGFILPGAGDAIGAGIGLLGIYSAFRMRAHPIVIARMFINLAVDSLLGSIPLLGAIFDIFYRAHTRNLHLLRTRDVRVPRRTDWLTVAAAAFAFVVALLLPVLIVIALVTYFV